MTEVARSLFLLLLVCGTKLCNAQHPEDSQKLEIDLGSCILQVLESCTDTAVTFFFYSSRENFTQIKSTDPKVPDSFLPNSPIKVFIHGWAGSLTKNFTETIRDAYLSTDPPHNVLIVDWIPLSSILCYVTSVVNTRQVASCTSQLLAALAKQEPLWDPAHLHVIGHSLGAHVSAFVSNDLQSLMGRKLARVTGLDPALPGFATIWLSKKLDPSDADFVDAIHTNAGTYGKIEPSGHADYYVNGGHLQPFCTAPGTHTALCSHLISIDYMAESVVSPRAFWGQPCVQEAAYLVVAKDSSPASWKWFTTPTVARCPPPSAANKPQWIGAYMGDAADLRTRGTFYVETAATYPYGLGRPNNSTVTFVLSPEALQELLLYVT